MTSKIERALAGIRRFFTGGYRTRMQGTHSKYMPHIGAKQRNRYATYKSWDQCRPVHWTSDALSEEIAYAPELK